MEKNLRSFLSQQTPRVEEEVVWGGSRLAFRVTSYLSRELPPPASITSVRSLVFQDGSVLLWRAPEGVHLFPGGRREPGETLEETLRREVLEETGWGLEAISPLGFMHFRHLRPRPDGYPYPYPDFIQLISRATAVESRPDARRLDTDAVEALFLPMDEVLALDLSPGQRLFLEAALQFILTLSTEP